MQIQLENSHQHSIQAYTDHSVSINNNTYQQNLILSVETMLVPWNIDTMYSLNAQHICELRLTHPKIILIGHNELNYIPNTEQMCVLYQTNIAIEWMSVGAACRTFNILL